MAEYAANFIYKPDRIHSAPDALSHIPALNSIGKPQSLLEAVRQAQKNSTDQEFLQIKRSVNNPTSEFSINQGLIVKFNQDSSPTVIPGDADQLKITVLTKLHTLPLGGHLGYRKLLELVRTHFQQMHLNASVQGFCQQCVLCQQTKIINYKPLGLL